MERLFKWVKENTDIKDPTVDNIIEYIADLKDRNRIGGKFQERCSELATGMLEIKSTIESLKL
jgi:hypothetical protein